MRIEDCKMEGNRLVLTLHRDGMVDARRFLIHFKPGEYTLAKARKKRSLDANAMLWRMCGLVGAAVGESKEAIYKKNIREAGVYDLAYIQSEAVIDFMEAWAKHGIGWFCDIADNGAVPGYKLVMAYKGSSEYDTKQMSRLIDSVMQDAEAVGVETMSEREKSLLLEDWGKGK